MESWIIRELKERNIEKLNVMLKCCRTFMPTVSLIISTLLVIIEPTVDIQ